MRKELFRSFLYYTILCIPHQYVVCGNFNLKSRKWPHGSPAECMKKLVQLVAILFIHLLRRNVKARIGVGQLTWRPSAPNGHRINMRLPLGLSARGGWVVWLRRPSLIIISIRIDLVSPHLFARGPHLLLFCSIPKSLAIDTGPGHNAKSVVETTTKSVTGLPRRLLLKARNTLRTLGCVHWLSWTV